MDRPASPPTVISPCRSAVELSPTHASNTLGLTTCRFANELQNRSSFLPNVNVSVHFSGVQVLVPSDLADEARRILNEAPESALSILAAIAGSAQRCLLRGRGV